MSDKRKYDSTVARMAGNIAAGIAARILGAGVQVDEVAVAHDCVSMARAIVEEVERTEPGSDSSRQATERALTETWIHDAEQAQASLAALGTLADKLRARGDPAAADELEAVLRTIVAAATKSS